eukprot:g3459.t1
MPNNTTNNTSSNNNNNNNNNSSNNNRRNRNNSSNNNRSNRNNRSNNNDNRPGTRNPKKNRDRKRRQQAQSPADQPRFTMTMDGVGVPAGILHDGAVTQPDHAKRRRLHGRSKRMPRHSNIPRQRPVSPDRFVDLTRPILTRLAECNAALRTADLAVFDARAELRMATADLMRWMRIMDHEIDPDEPDPDAALDVDLYLADTGGKHVCFRDPPDDDDAPGAAPMAGP